MAIYHCRVQIFGRGKGASAVAQAAYRAAECIKSEYARQIRDYICKRGIVHKEILLPGHAPREFADRSAFWNDAEKAEVPIKLKTSGFKTRKICTVDWNEPTKAEVWRAEREKLLAERFARVEEYYKLKDDVQNVVCLQRSAENIMREVSSERESTKRKRTHLR